MKKKVIIIIPICLCLCLICYTFFAPLKDLEWYIFADIEECSNIELHKNSDAKIEHYSTPKKDRKLKDLPYNSFYGIKYKSDELSFEMFAYEFQSEADARQYFENVTGDERDFRSSYYSLETLTSFRIIVYDGSNAYVVYTKPRYQEELSELFAKAFSVNIEDVENYLTK